MLSGLQVYDPYGEDLRILFPSLELGVDLLGERILELGGGCGSGSEGCCILFEVVREVLDGRDQCGSVLLDLLLECLLCCDLRTIYMILAYEETDQSIMHAVTHGVVSPLDESSEFVLHVFRELQFQSLNSKILFSERFPVKIFPEFDLPLLDLPCHMYCGYGLNIYVTTARYHIAGGIRLVVVLYYIFKTYISPLFLRIIRAIRESLGSWYS